MEFLSYYDKRCYFLFLSFNNLFNCTQNLRSSSINFSTNSSLTSWNSYIE